MKVLMIHNRTGSMYYRLVPLADKLQELGHEVHIHKWDEMVFRDEVRWADVVVLEMVYSPEVLKMVKDEGKVIVYEMDDIMDEVHHTHPAFVDMTKERKKMTLNSLKYADIVTVTTQPLKDRYLKQNKNIYVLPNYVHPDWLSRPVKKNRGQSIRIGWGGSVAHRPDLEFIEPILKRILKKNPQVKFIYAGDGGYGTGWTAYNFSKDQFKNLPLNRREYHPGTLPHIWPDKLASLQLDIAIAPLLETSWNAAKSTCKYLEYAMMKVPGVYAKWHYGWERESGEPFVKDGETGLLAAENAKEWELQLQYLIDNPEERDRIAENAYNDVTSNYLFEQHSREWIDVYNQAFSLVGKKE